MKLKLRFSSVFVRVISISFGFTLIAGAVFIFLMIERNIETEIFSLIRNIDRSVMRISSNEYQHYYFLMQSLKNIELNNIESETNIRMQLEKVFDLYGPEGETPFLISTAGYYFSDSPEIIFEFRDYTTGWSDKKNTINAVFKDKEWALVPSGNSKEMDDVLFIYKFGAKNNLIFIFKLDKDGFFDSYIKPSLAFSLSEYDLEWLNADSHSFKEIFNRNPGFFHDEYHFHPLNIIFKKSLREEDIFIIPIPGFNDSIRYISENLNGDESEKNNDFKTLPLERFDGTDKFPHFKQDYYLKIGHKNGPFYYSVELKAAINFLESILVLIGIGTAFYLAIFQAEKLRRLRMKEKEFVASITHELRTPLTVIQSAADNLSNGIVPQKKMLQYSSLIKEQSIRLGSMIEEILLFSNLEAKGNTAPEHIVIDLKKLLVELKKTLDTIAQSCGIELIWDVETLTGYCRSDPETISLVVRNLVTNALYHSYQKKPGTVRIIGKFVIPDYIAFIVEDDGRGIEQKDIKHIFEPFYRDSFSRQEQEKGSGLGLFISKRKTLLSGGKLTVESPYRRIDGKKKQGCKFEFSIPCSSFETNNKARGI